jgi:hypothetical protein
MYYAQYKLIINYLRNLAFNNGCPLLHQGKHLTRHKSNKVNITTFVLHLCTFKTPTF